MNRYADIPQIKSPTGKLMYATSKYPEVPLSENDTYVYTSIGDRYDILANQYYNDSSLWWVIVIANPDIDLSTLVIPNGSQIRIPSDIASIIYRFNTINQLGV